MVTGALTYLLCMVGNRIIGPCTEPMASFNGFSRYRKSQRIPKMMTEYRKLSAVQDAEVKVGYERKKEATPLQVLDPVAPAGTLGVYPRVAAQI
jgi:hypothetical protein